MAVISSQLQASALLNSFQFIVLSQQVLDISKSFAVNIASVHVMVPVCSV
jgi:hypothetical protein